MENLKWKYYNHALLPTTAPHEKIDESVIKQGILWKKKWGGVPLLIRWTTEFDCSKETDWWYCIKDTPFDINSLKSKRRYEINKGKKNFYVKLITPIEYKEEIYIVDKEAFTAYPLKSRPKVIKNNLYEDIEKNWGKGKCCGVFNKDNMLCGYALIFYQKKCIYLSSLKTIPKYEKLQINAALVAGLLENLTVELSNGFYICDGERNILHETAFQDYLEKYFGFRKAYCKLNIQYRPVFKFIINILYPFKNIIGFLKNISIFNKINALLFMEEIKKKG